MKNYIEETIILVALAFMTLYLYTEYMQVRTMNLFLFPTFLILALALIYLSKKNS